MNQTSHITHHASRVTRHAPRTTHHASRVTRHAPRITHHASRITHHASRITRHAPRITRHAPRITHHTSLLLCLCLIVTLLLGPVYAQKEKDPFKPQPNLFETGNQPNSLLTGTPEPQKDPFDIDVRAVPESVNRGQSLNIKVTISIPEGYQLYADKTGVKPVQIKGLTFGKVKGICPKFEKADPYQGKIPVYKECAIFELPVFVGTSADSGEQFIPLEVSYLGCTDTVCFLPQKNILEAAFNVVPKAVLRSGKTSDIEEKPISESEKVIRPAPAQDNPFRKMADKFGPLGVLIAAFLWGLLASLTPCVYPMIPVTVSVIGAGSGGSAYRGFILSLFYVLGMSLTYAILGTIAAWSGGIFGAYANHPAVRIIVAGVFVALALGMFDLFYIQTPSSVSSKLGGSKGFGVIGVFLTGAAAGAVVGPCVGPMLVALLIYIAALGSKIQGFLIMWNFALGMGMLFLVIGTFSGASLPKAGPWMETLKRIFGVILLGLALYYVKPLMTETIFMLVLGSFLIGLSVFMGAFDPINAESVTQDRLRKGAGIVCLVLGVGYAAGFTLSDRLPIYTRDISPKSGINWMTNEAAALDRARQEKKPLMIDFRADWCAACKKMERETFTDPSVTDMANQFICLKIDCTETSDPEVINIQKKYQVIGLPTIRFINSRGEHVPDQTITEFVRSSELLRRMRRVR